MALTPSQCNAISMPRFRKSKHFRKSLPAKNLRHLQLHNSPANGLNDWSRGDQHQRKSFAGNDLSLVVSEPSWSKFERAAPAH